MPSQGDIVLVPVPFTDLSSNRKRPVIVISTDQFNQSTRDMVMVAMTSNLTPSPYSFVINQTDLASRKLNHPGRVRVDKVFTLAQSIAIKVFGRVADPILDRIRQLLIDLCRK